MKTIAAALLAFGLTIAPLTVLAQDEGADTEDPAEARAAAFEAADGAQTENIPGGGLLIGAYGVIFVLLLGYVVSLGYRQAQIGTDIERLKKDLETAKGGAEK